MIWDYLKRNLDTYRHFDIGNSIDFEKFNLYSMVHHSTAIEGSTLTEGDTELLLEKNITPEGKPFDHSVMVKDCYNALNYSLKKAEEKFFSFTPEFLANINTHVMKNLGGVNNHILGNFDSSKGEYRTGASFAQGGGYYVNADKIERLVKVFCEEINERISLVNNPVDAYKLSFDAHFNIVSIHPWGDGNGRTSRLVMNVIQKHFNLPLSKVYVTDRAKYIDALKATRKKDDINIFRNFMCEQQNKFFREKILEYKQSQKKSGGFKFMF